MTSRAIPTMLAVVLLAGCGSSSSGKSSTAAPAASSGSGTSTNAASGGAAAASTSDSVTIGYERMPIENGPDIGSPGTTQTGTVDGISCGPTEQLAYHIHAHLAVFVNGSPRALPAGIGIPGSAPQQTAQGPVAVGGQCIYWLHTHTADGVIHIESPTSRIYTLGQFFDEWHQPLSSGQVGSAAGTVTAFLNGKRWTKSPGAIPLVPHAAIQLDVGSPMTPFRAVPWSETQL